MKLWHFVVSFFQAFALGSIGTREAIHEDDCREYVFGFLRMLQSKTNLDQKISCCIEHGYSVALRKIVWRRARDLSDTSSSVLSMLDTQRHSEGAIPLITQVCLISFVWDGYRIP
jgi:hypothetical protein